MIMKRASGLPVPKTKLFRSFPSWHLWHVFVSRKRSASFFRFGEGAGDDPAARAPIPDRMNLCTGSGVAAGFEPVVPSGERTLVDATAVGKARGAFSSRRRRSAGALGQENESEKI